MMDFDDLVAVYNKLEETASGNEMREILANFFAKVPKEDLKTVVYLTLGTISSDYESSVLGLAEKSVLKSIATAGGINVDKVKKMVQEMGDGGLAAEKILQKKPMTLVPISKLTVQELYKGLHKICTFSGSGSQDSKTNTLASLLQKASASGAKYVIRIALGTLRMGAGDMTVLSALAIAFTNGKENKEALERAYNICPDAGHIAEVLAKDGLLGLEKIDIEVGRPIKMMLAQRVKSLSEISKKMPGKVSVEGKYDGERIQIHKTKEGKISLFSRRLDTITDQFPDLVEYLTKQVKADEFIIEGEVMAIDEKGKHLPFQTLMQRRRKHEIEKYVKEIPIQLKAFDLLYLNGEVFMNKHYQERIKAVEKIVTKGKNLTVADRIVTDKIEEIEKFFSDMLAQKQEGIMIKSLSGEYQAGTRGWNWIKWKKDYSEINDTLDLVVIGGYYGRGKRSGVYGALLCACYNDIEDTFETVCKLGTGLTDQVLSELPEKLKKYESEKKPARVVVGKEMIPDVWFTPEIVVEVLGAEITKSPYHTCGLAVRFPRFIQFRDNKKAEQATTSTEVNEMS